MTEKNVVKQNRIKCGECKQEFQVKDNEFKATEILKEQSLSDAKIIFIKNEIPILNSITFFQMYEQYTLNKTRIDLDVHEHFK